MTVLPARPDLNPGGRVLITCSAQRPTKCMNTFSWPRQPGAFTAMLRGGRLLSNTEAMELKAQGWHVEQEPTDEGVRDHWICPLHPASVSSSVAGPDGGTA